EHDMYFLGWGTVTGDADYGLYALFHSEEIAPAGNNWHFADDPELDRLLEEARVNTDPQAREELYAQAIELIWDDAQWIFLHSISQLNGVRNEVAGLVHHPREHIEVMDAYFVD
ncbi:MAG: glutathione ABC transporter substrate-binding protein, partial [Halanaerobium sp. MSAO_Bac5]